MARRRSKSEQVLEKARKVGVLRARDLARTGIPRVYLRRLHERGLLVRSGRGLYTLSDHEVSANHSLAQVGAKVPRGVVCLLSALRFHGLTTQAPAEVWLAIDWKARAPKSEGLALRIVRMSGEALRAGVEEHEVEGVIVRVFGAAKTVADCFKFRNKIGLDVALEALRDYRRTRRAGMDALWRFARICRVAGVMRPYLEATA
jgi:predicted transcriptional regulator of viral defense system